MRAGRRHGHSEEQELRACVLSLPEARKSELLPGCVASGKIQYLISEPASSSDDTIYCKVVLCMKSIYPQAQSRCSERPDPARKEPFLHLPFL